jgi:hypothetical protein
MRPCREPSQDGNAGRDESQPAARRRRKERRCSFQISVCVPGIPAGNKYLSRSHRQTESRRSGDPCSAARDTKRVDQVVPYKNSLTCPDRGLATFGHDHSCLVVRDGKSGYAPVEMTKGRVVMARDEMLWWASPIVFGPRTLVRTWGIPVDLSARSRLEREARGIPGLVAGIEPKTALPASCNVRQRVVALIW